VPGTRAPSTAQIPLAEKARESVALLRSHHANAAATAGFEWVFDDLLAYDHLLRKYTGRALENATVLEIGFGARPWRLLALLAAGVDAEGIDAEVPILDGTLGEFTAALRTNGFERVLKSVVRHLLYDSRERRQFDAALTAHGMARTVDSGRFHVANAAEFEPTRRFNLIVSEDVFEHIDRAALPVVTRRMRRWLTTDGLALIRPNVFTGITGGHALDWSRESFTRPTRRTVEPWDHLRRAEHRPNTSLNRLTRKEYREVFSGVFDILQEDVAQPDLGREFLAGAAARELAVWPDEELFSNQVRMVLRPRT
jgi:hypothetical protein